MLASPIDSDQIVITASRAPEQAKDAPASVTVIDAQEIQRLGNSLVPDLLRLVPSAAVSVSGPTGSLTDIRIRGAEANHTLLFIDGIRANDPASGDQPRFDLLNADIVSRIEVIRGPQSALWGSDAIGGVVAVNGMPEKASGFAAALESGSFGFARASSSFAEVSDVSTLAAALAFQHATGIDSFNGVGDKDGYHNLSGRVRGTYQLAPVVQLGIAAFAIHAYDQFDGFGPFFPFPHEDTRDNTRNRMAAGRAWAQFGETGSSWSGRIAGSILGSSNRNYLADQFLNETTGGRSIFDAQVEHRMVTGAIAQTLIAGVEAEHETFGANDIIYGGATDQRRTRDHQSVTLEWRAEARLFTGDLALRRDMFNRFSDATTVRASLLAKLGGGFGLAGSYGEGISPPTFFDLYGFFPGSFVGNPSLKPETSRGYELAFRYNRGAFGASLTGYRQRLHDEIIDTFPDTFLSSTANTHGLSYRSGVEAELRFQIDGQLRMRANYAYLHATQPNEAGTGQVAELRRPKNSGSVELDGVSGRFTYGGSIAYVGAHLDRNQDPPYQLLSLPSYWPAEARIAYALDRRIELFARASNIFNAHYEDVIGYRTQGRAIYAGVRLTSPGK